MIFRQKNTFFENYNLTPLDMYYELSKVYIVSEQKEESIFIQRVNVDSLCV